MSRRHGERRPPICAYSMADLAAKRLEALALCDESAWPCSRLYDALQQLVQGDGVVVGGCWQLVPRPANAVPLDPQLDALFFAQLVRAEGEARALNAGPPGCRQVEAFGMSPDDRTVAAIEKRHASTRPRRSKGRGS